MNIQTILMLAGAYALYKKAQAPVQPGTAAVNQLPPNPAPAPVSYEAPVASDLPTITPIQEAPSNIYQAPLPPTAMPPPGSYNSGAQLAPLPATSPNLIGISPAPIRRPGGGNAPAPLPITELPAVPPAKIGFLMPISQRGGQNSITRRYYDPTTGTWQTVY